MLTGIELIVINITNNYTVMSLSHGGILKFTLKVEFTCSPENAEVLPIPRSEYTRTSQGETNLLKTRCLKIKYLDTLSF